MRQKLVSVAAAAASVLLMTVVRGTDASADPGYCDPHTPAAPGHPIPYKERKGRCEGVYQQPVAAATLSVVAFTAAFKPFDLENASPLKVTWPAGAGTLVKVRAKSLKRDLYYQMDTISPAESGTFVWPVDVLQALNIGKDDLAVQGWTEVSLQGSDRRVHLPLTIGRDDGSGAGGTYELLVVPGEELRELRVSLQQFDSDGRHLATVKQDERLAVSYLPRNRGVPITFENLPGAGYYYVELTGVPKLRRPRTTSFWFYHPGS